MQSLLELNDCPQFTFDALSCQNELNFSVDLRPLRTNDDDVDDDLF